YYTGLFVAGTTGCSPPAGSGSPPAQLTNGAKMQLSGSGYSPNLFYYCASYASVASTGATLSSFTISWGLGSTVFSQTILSVAVPPEPPPTALSVVRGIDNGLYYATLAVSWSGWQSLGGSVSSSPVLAASAGLNRLDVVVEGEAGSIWHKAFINGVWSPAWDSPMGITSDVPAVSSDGQTLHVVVRGAGNDLWYNSLNFTTSFWSGWIPLKGTT